MRYPGSEVPRRRCHPHLPAHRAGSDRTPRLLADSGQREWVTDQGETGPLDVPVAWSCRKRWLPSHPPAPDGFGRVAARAQRGMAEHFSRDRLLPALLDRLIDETAARARPKSVESRVLSKAGTAPERAARPRLALQRAGGGGRHDRRRGVPACAAFDHQLRHRAAVRDPGLQARSRRPRADAAPGDHRFRASPPAGQRHGAAASRRRTRWATTTR